MKKFTFVAAMLLSATIAFAASYEHSVGVNVGGLYGASYKAFLFGNDNLALQIDLGVRLEETAGSFKYKIGDSSSKFKFKSANFYTFEVNPNVMYQDEFYSFNGGSLSWFAGGGVSLGLMGEYSWCSIKHESWNNYDWPYRIITNENGANTIYGKFGINAIAGLELEFSKVPLALSFDFRPGYGLGFWGKKVNDVKYNSTLNFFDYTISVGLRYCI